MEQTIFNNIKIKIRNLELLTPEEKKSINTMSEKQKEEIIIIYNDIIQSFIDYLNN